MGFLNYGSAKGLSTKHDFQKDIQNLYQAEAYKAQILAEKEQKTKYYAGLMKQHTAVAPSMVRELEGKYKDLNKQVAEFAVKNPHFETDVNLMQEFNTITDQYLNNDSVRKDMQAQEQFELLKAEYNKGDMEEDEFEIEMDRYTDWMENGGDGYVFQKPNLPTYTNILTESEAALMPDVVPGKDSVTGRWQSVTKTPIGRIRERAYSDFSVPKIAKVITAAYNERIANNPKFKEMYRSPLQWHVKVLDQNEAVKTVNTAFDPRYARNAAAQERAQKDMRESFPHFSINVGSSYSSDDGIVEGDKAIAAFTPFLEKNGLVNFGKNGPRVWRQDENGAYIELTNTLDGEYTLKNATKMQHLPGTGSLIQVELQTPVNAKEKYTETIYNVLKNGKQILNEDGEPHYMTADELKQWKEENKFNKRELEKMKGDKDKDATNVEKGGDEYSYSMRAPETAKDEFYKDIGFQSKGIQREGLSSITDDGKVTHVIMSGTLWVEGNITEESLYGYEKISGGVDHAKKVISAGHTTEHGFMQGQTREGNYAIAAEFLNDKYGDTGTVLHENSDGTKADEDNYERKTTIGLWQKHPEDPDMYYRTKVVRNKLNNTERVTYEGYNISTGEKGKLI